MRLIIHNLFHQSIQSEYITPSALPFCLTVPLILFPYKQNQVPIPTQKEKALQYGCNSFCKPLTAKDAQTL